MSIADSSRSALKWGVTRTVGELPFFEYRLRATCWKAARQLREREGAEVAALARQGVRIPRSEVATIIPTYRRPDRLGDSVESALAQSFTDQQVVVVDDGAGVEATLPDDPRLTVVHLSRNVGVAGVVRNVGIGISDSRLIAFLDDDNTWEPDHLERAVEAHRAGAEFTYSSLRRVDADGELVDVLGEPFSRRAMRERSLVDTNVIVVRRGPDVHFSRTPRHRGDFPLEDWELTWRLSRRLRVQHIPAITVRYVQHAGSNYSEWGGDSPS